MMPRLPRWGAARRSLWRTDRASRRAGSGSAEAGAPSSPRFAASGRGLRRELGALAQRVFQVGRYAVFFQKICEGFARQILEGLHAVARELLELVERILVEFDQLAHDCLARLQVTRLPGPGNPGRLRWF